MLLMKNKNHDQTHPEPDIPNGVFEYIVKVDDTLTKIALRFHTTIGELSTLNHLSSQMIYPSQILYIPNFEKDEEKCITPIKMPEPVVTQIERSPLFPGFVKPLQLVDVPEVEKPYSLTICEGCLTIEASLMSSQNIDEKMLIELNLNPTCVTLRRILQMNDKRGMLEGILNDNFALKKKYTIPFKNIDSFMFFNTKEGVLKNDPADYFVEPVPEKEVNDPLSDPPIRKFPKTKNASIDETSAKQTNVTFLSVPVTFDSESNANDYILVSHNRLLSDNIFKVNKKNKEGKSCFDSCTNLESLSGGSKSSMKIIKNCPDSKLLSRTPQLEDKKNGSRVRLSSLGEEEKQKTPSKVNRQGINIKNKIWRNKSPSICLKNDTQSPAVYISINIRPGMLKDSINMFKEFGNIFNADDPKLVIELNSDHVGLFREFVGDKLQKYTNIATEKAEVKVTSCLDDKVSCAQNNIVTSSIDVLPKLSEPSKILSPILLSQLSDYFPSRALMQPMTLGYSTLVHGTSMKTWYRNMLSFSDVPSLLIIREETDNIFGAILSCIPRISYEFYGNGECILFKKPFDNTVKFFPWTQKNMYFIKGDSSYFAIGGGKSGYGLWLNENLIDGHTSICETFDNEILSSQSDFRIQILEVWIFE